MSDIASFGFAVDTAPLNAADAALERLGKTAAGVEAIINKMSANVSSAFAKVPSSLSGRAGGGAASSPSTTSAEAAAQASLATATASTTAALHGQNAALHSGAQAHATHSAAAYANRLQMMELAHVGRALFDEMAAGGNIFRALAMEGGRLQMALSTGEGGLGGLVGRLGSGMSALANPIALATTGMVAFGVASAIAFASYESGQDKLANSLNGIGRRSGATVGQLNQIAAAGAASGGLSESQSLGLVAQYTGAGLSPGVTGSLLGSTRDYARVTGTGADEAGNALAGALKDPIKGLGTLDERLGFVDDALRQTVLNLEHSGHIEEAQVLAADALRKALDATKDSTWAFSRALDGAENFLSNVWHGVGTGIARTFGMNSDQDKLDQNRRTLANLQSVDPIGNADYIAQLRLEIERLSKAVGEDAANAEAKSRDAQAIQKSGVAGDAVRAILPDLVRAQNASAQIEALRQAVADPDIMRHLIAGGIGAGQVSQAYGNAIVMQSQAAPGLRQKQDYDLAIDSANAFSVGEKAVVEARRAELAVLRETGDVTRAATAAQMTLNEAIAKGNSDADDRLTKAKQDFGLVGLSPYQRAMQELKNKYDGDGGIFARDEVTSSRALDDPNIKKDIGGASKLENAAIDAAMTIHSAGDRLAAALDGVATKMVGAGPGASPYGILQPFTGKAGGATATAPMMAMMQAYVQAGYSPAAAAGFVAGTSMESGTSLDPNASNGSHIGIAQWDRARWGQVQSLLGEGAGTRGGQIIASLNELRGSESRAGSMLAGSDSVLGGVIASDAYERPGDAEAARRRDTAIARGNALYTAYSGSPAPMTIHPALQAVAPLTPDMLGKDHQAYADNQAAVNKQFTSADPTLFGTPLGDANRSLDTQRAVLKMQADTFGQSAAAIKGASEAQQLWNRYTSEGITPTGALSDKIKAYGVDAAAVAKQQQDQLAQQQSIIGTADAFRGDFSSVFTSGFQSASQGKGFGAGLSSALDRIGQNLIGGGVNQITSGLFGKTGTPGGGILGNLFSSLPHLAAGTSDASGGPTIVGEKGPELVQMPAHAQVISNEALGSMRSGSPNVSIGGHSIVVQGSADEKTVAMMDAKLAAANEQQWQRIVRDLPQIQQDSQQTS